MKKCGIFNSEISSVVASMGHKDMIAIVDMGFPIPDGVKKIDLVVDRGDPKFEDVLKALLKELQVENVMIANESSEDFEKLIRDSLPDVGIFKIPHEELKGMSKKVKAVIRTGEDTPYYNAILISGVIF